MEQSEPTPHTPSAYLRNLSDYRAANEGAHPKVPPRLSAPALNWHVAIWNPTPVVGSEDKRHLGDDKSFIDWSRYLAEIVIHILNNAANTPLDANGVRLSELNKAKDQAVYVFGFRLIYSDSEKRYGLDYSGDDYQPADALRDRSFNLSYKWDGHLVKTSVVISREFTTITHWLSVYEYENELTRGKAVFSGARDKDGIPLKGSAPRILRASLARIFCTIQQFPETEEQRTDTFAEYCADELDASCLKLSLNHVYTQLWADFAKAQYSTGENLFDDSVFAMEIGKFPNIEFPEDEDNIDINRAPRPGRSSGKYFRLKKFADFRSVILPTSLPFSAREADTASRPIDIDKRFDSSEATRISTNIARMFFEENLIRSEITSSLFLRHRVIYQSSLGSMAKGADVSGDRPVRFLMLTAPGWRWQLGRLVERLNALGTYRLASLRQIKGVQAAGDQIRSIGESLDEDKYNLEASSLTEINERFAKIGVEPALYGGLSYRLEQSRYYVDCFNRLVKDLDVKRIEGFQPYEEFVRRRYANTWDYINRIGIRYERLRSRIEFYSQLRRTEQQVELLKSAEDVAVIPISYYGGYVLGAVYSSVWHVEPGSHNAGTALITAAAYSLFIIVYRMRRRDFATARFFVYWIVFWSCILLSFTMVDWSYKSVQHVSIEAADEVNMAKGAARH